MAKAIPGRAAPLLAQMVDELGTLEKEFAPLQAKAARIVVLRKSIRAFYSASPAADAIVITGERFVVYLGAAGLQRVVDHVALIKRIGIKAFAAIARVSLAVLEESQPCDVVLQVVATEQTGPRSIRITERGTT